MLELLNVVFLVAIVLLLVVEPRFATIRWWWTFIALQSLAMLNDRLWDLANNISVIALLLFVISNCSRMSETGRNISYSIAAAVTVGLIARDIGYPDAIPRWVVDWVQAIGYWCACMLQLALSFLERDTRRRLELYKITIFMLPAIASILLLHVSNLSHCITVVLVLQTAVFLWLVSTTGIMGLRLVIRRTDHESIPGAISNGVVLLNHFVKNRLTNIILLSRQLAEDRRTGAFAAAQADELAVTLERIEQTSRQFLETVKKLHHYLGELSVTPRSVRLDKVLKGSIEELRPYLDAHNARVEAQFPANVSVLADPSVLRKSLIYVIRNSVEACQLRNEDCSIHIETCKDGSDMELVIRDNGPGFSYEALERAIEPFYTTKGSQHIGLGLTYTHLTVNAMGGQLVLANRHDASGACVILRLKSRRRLLQWELFES